MADRSIDSCIVLLALALQFILFGVLANQPTQKPMYITVPPKKIAEVVVSEDIKKLEEYYTIKEYEYLLSEGLDEDQIASVQTSVMYATIPIGRYFITAYNDEETACKTTASGVRCHEGTITTCAADVWGGYFKFGDIIEVDGRLYRVEDTGSAVKKRHIDLFFDKYKDMARYGSNYQIIYRVEFPFGVPQNK